MKKRNELLDDYLVEVEQIELSLRMVADLCYKSRDTEFVNGEILLQIGDFLKNYLDRSRSARFYFLDRKRGIELCSFGVKGEFTKFKEKYEN